MEITELNMIADFQAGMKSLQNPSFLSIVSQVCSFWKWGALVFAIFATFSSLIRRIKLVLIRFTVKPCANLREEIVDFSDGDEISSASSDDEQDGDESRNTMSLRSRHRRTDGDFRVKTSSHWFKSQGRNGHLRRRSNGSAWSEFAPGKSVVRLWDSLGILNLDFDEDLFNFDPKNVVSTWETDRDLMTSDFPVGQWNSPADASVESPTVYLTAEGCRSGEGVILGGYDSRMRRRVPALYAEWRSPAENVSGDSSGGVGQVYVRNDVSRIVTVCDVRNVRRPLESVKESNGGTWWHADAVTA